MKTRKIDTITDNDEQVRFEIFDGTLPADRAYEELARLLKEQSAAERRRFSETIDRLFGIIGQYRDKFGPL